MANKEIEIPIVLSSDIGDNKFATFDDAVLTVANGRIMVVTRPGFAASALLGTLKPLDSDLTLFQVPAVPNKGAATFALSPAVGEALLRLARVVPLGSDAALEATLARMVSQIKRRRTEGIVDYESETQIRFLCQAQGFPTTKPALIELGAQLGLNLSPRWTKAQLCGALSVRLHPMSPSLIVAEDYDKPGSRISLVTRAQVDALTPRQEDTLVDDFTVRCKEQSGDAPCNLLVLYHDLAALYYVVMSQILGGAFDPRPVLMLAPGDSPARVIELCRLQFGVGVDGNYDILQYQGQTRRVRFLQIPISSLSATYATGTAKVYLQSYLSPADFLPENQRVIFMDYVRTGASYAEFVKILQVLVPDYVARLARLYGLPGASEVKQIPEVINLNYALSEESALRHVFFTNGARCLPHVRFIGDNLDNPGPATLPASMGCVSDIIALYLIYAKFQALEDRKRYRRFPELAPQGAYF